MLRGAWRGVAVALWLGSGLAFGRAAAAVSQISGPQATSVSTNPGQAGHAPEKIGSVATKDASVAGALEVTGGRAVLVGASSVTARDHAAEVSLERGGSVRICQTSLVKLSQGKAAEGSSGAPLLLALDRGALEVKTQAIGGDAILTPDLRFTVRGSGAAGPLDLRLRVTTNGDTCVEEHGGATAPTLVITDTFGEASYEVRGGQHVLFEHGSLREVVDHESSPCGCPEATMSLAEAALRPPGDAATPAEAAARQNPFPAAESAGLAQGSEVPQAPPGVVHTQVAATLGYEGADAAPAAASAPATKPSAAATAPAPASASSSEEQHGFRHALGRFFHKLFGGG